MRTRILIAFSAVLALLPPAPARAASAGPAAELATALPPRAAVLAALDADPAVARARAGQAAAEARAAARLRGPHEWTLEGQLQNRDAGSEGGFREWEVSVQRALRLPGKAELDRQIASAERALGGNALAEARHSAAVNLLEHWVEWLAASELSLHRGAAADIAARDRGSAQLRFARGDLSAAGLDAATAADAQAARALQEAELREQEAALALSARFPAIIRPSPAPRLPPPAEIDPDWPAWAEQAIDLDHESRVAQGRAELARLDAERAYQDRRADPSFGLRTLSERGGQERALGLFVSIPLGRGVRGHVAAEQTALADAAEVEAAAIRREIDLKARTLARRAGLLTQAWRLAQASASAQGEEARRLAEGYALGGVDLTELLAARRRASEAAAAEVEARAAAFSAAARLLLDAHAYWLETSAQTGADHLHPDH
ncbi:TolC family protein [Aquimonas voraii]|uniref:Outer membrane protein TolC n=1 Tax=Aquimonas voraii TaxID=265719 RepID=A0A1G6XB59_9GAMM|nr:TolC family protein [Aquimonas voraii]SDD75410.1 hypothetical protein SAMN04488509_106142 [Aquimonas voraii]